MSRLSLPAPTRPLVLAALAVLLALAFGAGTARAAGPHYGAFADVAPLIPVDRATAATVIADASDEATTTIATPFAVSAYGSSATTLTVGTNGYVGLGGTTAPVITADDTTDFGSAVISPMTTDLTTGTDGGVFFEVRGTAPARQLVIEWDVAACCAPGTAATARFQAIFTEGEESYELRYAGTLGATTGWIGTKADVTELTRFGDEANGYPAAGTRITIAELSVRADARGDGTPALSGHAVDDTAGVELALYAGTDTSAPPAATLTTTPAPGGDFAAALDGAAALPDGSYTVVARQPTGGQRSAPRTFVVDTTAPAPALTDPDSRTATATPDLAGVAGTDPGDGRHLDLLLYAGAAATGSPIATLPVTADGSGAFIATPPADLDDGTYTVQAAQSDDLGNLGASAPRTFTVDTAAPAVALNAVARRTNDATPSLSGTAGVAVGDSAGVDLDVYAGTAAAGVPVTTLPTVANGSGAFHGTPSRGLVDGTYTVAARQSDDVGNESTSAAQTFTVDTTAPAPALSSPADGASVVDTTPTFTGAAGTAMGDDLRIKLDIYPGTAAVGSALRRLSVTAAGSGLFSVSPASGLPVGQYAARVAQSDDVGNGGTGEVVRFAVRAPDPSVPPVTPPTTTVPAATPVPIASAAPTDDNTGDAGTDDGGDVGGDPDAADASATPAADACKSGRLLRRHLARPKGSSLKATATLNGKKVKVTIGRKQLVITADLRGKGQGTYTLEITTTITPPTGKKRSPVKDVRRFVYHIC